MTRPAPKLTDLPMIKEGRAERLAAAGIDTVEKLWKADLAKLAEHPAFQADEGFLNQVPLLQGFAEAHAKGAAIVYAEDPRIFELPEPITHMDLEFDGPASEIFLYGLLHHDTNRTEQWFDHRKAEQERMLKEFRDLCLQGGTVVTWGGRSSDLVQLRRACQRHGVDPKWIGQTKWFDLQADLVFTGSPETQRLYLPVRKFGSDLVAAYFGYQKPRLRVKDGYQALRMYRAYKRSQDPQLKQDLMAYNAEDLRHLKVVLDGVRELMRPRR